MIKQFFTLTFRNLMRDRVFSFLNLTNLIVGFAAFILLTLFIHEHLNYDKHNENYNRIYRLQTFMNQSQNTIQHTWSVTAALSRHELTKLPEIEQVVLIHDVGDNNKEGVFYTTDKVNQFLFRYGYYSDQSVFDIFTFRFIEGEINNALTQPFSIVLSSSMAKKLFPGGNAIGKQLYGENKFVFTVTGIYKDFPRSSTWNPTYLVSMNSFAQLTKYTTFESNYRGYGFGTFVLLKENAKSASVDEKIKGALKEYNKDHSPYLWPFSLIHVKPGNDDGALLKILILFSFIALLILVLSSINFINLQTANATTRLREIGVKKTVGFTRKYLYYQFILESVIIAVFAGVMGIEVSQLFLPWFNDIMGLSMVQNVYSNGNLIVFILLVTIITGLLSGLYPAFVISAYNPVKALKQKFVQEEPNGFSLKKVLITIQFSISLLLLIVSFIIFRQTNFMINKDLGFDSEKVLFANVVTNKKGSFDQIRNRLINHPEIIDACLSDYIPFILPGGNDLSWEGSGSEEKVFVRYYFISYDFFQTYNIKIKEGRIFSREYPADREKCIINETAAKVFGWQQPIGKRINLRNKQVEVIGVTSDFVANSLHNPIEPHMYRLVNDSASLNGIYSLRFSPGNEVKAKQIMASEFKRYFPDDAFEFKNIQNVIQNDVPLKFWKSFSKITVFFSVLSILISSIGLFGLVMFFTKRKMKEIGLRKVFGFSFQNLYITLSAGFVKLILVSIFIAWPAALYIYKNLPGAAKYQLQIWEFLAATLIILSVAIITISYQIIKVSVSNPVEILKYE